MKPTDPADLPRDDSDASEHAEQPQAPGVEPQAENAPPLTEQPAPSKAPTNAEIAERMLAGLPGRFVPGPGETASAEKGPNSLWAGLESAQKLAKLLFFEPGVVVEVRAVNSKGYAGRIASGYFDTPLKFLQAVAQRDGTFDGLYATLNRVNPELIARAVNRVKDRALVTTSDSDITERRWCLIDVDPVRPSGISSTDEEHAHALEVSAAIADELTELGWPAPVRADSGNGGHLLYRLGEGCDDGALLERCLKALAMQFDSEQSIVDTSVTKRAQISKLYGSMACKGDSTAERPHRRSAILDMPDELVPVTREQLEALAGRLPSDRDRAPRYAASTSGGRQHDVPAMLASAGLSVLRQGPWDGKYRWVLDTCPWNPSHGPGKAWVARFPSGAMAAGCLHSGCAGRGWADLKSLIYPSTKAASASAGASSADSAGTPAVPANVDAAAAALSDWGEQDGQEYAQASTAVPARDVVSQEAAEPRIRRRGEFRVGDLVSPSDRENQGEVTGFEDGWIWVYFLNSDTGHSANKRFLPAQLKLLRPVEEHTVIRVLSTQDVLDFVLQPWLIDGVLKQGELSVMFGTPGAGKSMVALDMALCITQGRPWNGHETAVGPVVYIAAEGQGGVKLRMLAWNEGRRPDCSTDEWQRFKVIAEAVQLVGEDLGVLVEAVGRYAKGAKLVIVDTLARTALGLEENSAKDMGKYVHAADQLRKHTKAAVMVVHHSAKPKDDQPLTSRGSSAIKGGVDTEIAVTKEESGHVMVACAKQKDAPDFDAMLMHMESIDLSEVAQTPGLTGGRVVYVGPAAEPEKDGKREKRGKSRPRTSTQSEQALLDTFENSFRGKWVSVNKLLPASRIPRSTFYRVLQRLVERGVVEEQTVGNRIEYRPKTTSLMSQSQSVSPSPTGSAAPSIPRVSPVPTPLGGGTVRRDRGMGDVSAESEVGQ
ncbi:MAG: AAA family ATPase [Planctomycetaceae bacterium]|nr:AAA family ATPase [Planctomycetaceae bacterium]